MPLPRKLTDTDIEVLSLHFYDGFSMREIAVFLDITKASVQDRIEKCLKYFKDSGIPKPKYINAPQEGKKPMKKFQYDPSKIDDLIYWKGQH